MTVLQVQPGFSTHGAKSVTVGTYGNLCNRSACTSPTTTPARWYNRGSGAFYCGECAFRINSANRREQLSDGKPLCILVTQAEYDEYAAQFTKDAKTNGSGFLEVGHNDRGEIIVNHPDLPRDEHGVAHIIFSLDEAVAFAETILRRVEQVRKEQRPPFAEGLHKLRQIYAAGFIHDDDCPAKRSKKFVRCTCDPLAPPKSDLAPSGG